MIIKNSGNSRKKSVDKFISLYIIIRIVFKKAGFYSFLFIHLQNIRLKMKVGMNISFLEKRMGNPSSRKGGEDKVL